MAPSACGGVSWNAAIHCHSAEEPSPERTHGLVPSFASQRGHVSDARGLETVSTLPAATTSRDCIAVLSVLGFRIVAANASYVTLRGLTGRRVLIPRQASLDANELATVLLFGDVDPAAYLRARGHVASGEFAAPGGEAERNRAGASEQRRSSASRRRPRARRAVSLKKYSR